MTLWLFGSLLLIGIWYAIKNYQMMARTPEAAADYILETMMDPVLFISRDLLIRDTNKALIDICGYKKEELVGQTINLLLDENSANQLDLQQLLLKGPLQNAELNILSKDQRIIPCLFAGSVMYDRFGECLGIVCVFHDITDRQKSESILREAKDELEREVQRRTTELEETNEVLKKEIMDRRKAQDQIRFIAFHDELTGLPNRLLLNDRIDQAIQQTQRNGNELAVIFLNLDNFKLINDSLGHSAGDLLLRQAAERIKAVTRESDTLSRVGGDEFIILATNLRDLNGIDVILDKIMGVFTEPFLIHEHENFVSVSMGIAIHPANGQDVETLIRNADMAMYEAKAAGRATYRYCFGDMKDRSIERMNMRNSLFRALERNELSVHYQPLINTQTGKIGGFEALMRWKLNQGKSISPGVFIPVAEESGSIIPMGEWLIRTACLQIRTWHEMGYEQLSMAINLSENQLKQRGFVKRVANILEEVGLHPSFLEFEITERIVFRSNDNIIKVLDDLKTLGIAISIDDFGIDHSSFMNIKKLPIDKIKLAAEFVQGIPANRTDGAIVDAIIDLSHKMGLRVVAEGVETFEQLTYLKNRTCDQVQGYFFYKPMPCTKVDELLVKSSLLPRVRTLTLRF